MASSATEMAIFQRVAERGSFAGAADDVGLSPSAVAKLITRLEQRLGVRLINRTTRHLALTAEGEIYLDRVREILASIEAADSEVSSARASPRGHLRVHTFPVIAAHDLAPALPLGWSRARSSISDGSFAQAQATSPITDGRSNLPISLVMRA